MNKEDKQKAYLMELQMAIGKEIPGLIRKYAGQETIPMKDLQQILLDATMYMSSDECMYKHIEEVQLQKIANSMGEVNYN